LKITIGNTATLGANLLGQRFDLINHCDKVLRGYRRRQARKLRRPARILGRGDNGQARTASKGGSEQSKNCGFYLHNHKITYCQPNAICRTLF